MGRTVSLLGRWVMSATPKPTQTAGIHPIGGMGVPHPGCYCRNCEAARPVIDAERIDTAAPERSPSEMLCVIGFGHVTGFNGRCINCGTWMLPKEPKHQTAAQ
jgi:hypothetical protein